MFGRTKRIFSILTILVFGSTVFFTGSPIVHAVAVEVNLPDFQKGICYATWTKDRFKSKYSDQSLEMLKNMGVECLQVNVTQFQEKVNSTKIFPTDCTPSDNSVKHVIKKAHKLGLKIMLKPHIDLISSDQGYWRADIGFYEKSGWEDWFKEYTKFIIHYAKMAQKYDVEIFCVGTELSFTTQQTESWRQVIASIREVYDGKLIYAANWDNYSCIGFWNELDYVGIDAYFPLTYKNDPSVEDIRNGWRKWVCEIENWHKEVQKPVVFTEIGYPSSVHAPYEPWKNGSGNPDVNIQAKCYTAFFDVVWKQPWLGGVYWWRWAPTVFGGGKNNRHFTPLKKPAAELIEKNYKAGRKTDFYEKVPIKEDGLSSIRNNVIANPEQLLMPAVNPQVNILNTSTLQPVLKTQKDTEFRKDWQVKHMKESQN